MKTQSNLFTHKTFVISPLWSGDATDQSATVASHVYGFDFDEEELARELSAPLPACLLDQPAHLVEAEEFERLYHWFCS